jgi:ectoine hydroxylase-related dioxygenase (phytanoyl-CoA dioxygenase family)
LHAPRRWDQNGAEEAPLTRTDPHVTQYRDQGYLVVERLFDADTVQRLIAEGTALCRGERGPVQGLEPVRPGDSDAEIMARYQVCPMAHKASPLYRETMADPRLTAVLTRLIGPNVKAMHSQLYLKHAGMPGNAWHQDEMFIPTRDRSLLTAWIALDPATVENGCLKLLAGSHRAGVLWPMRRHHDPDLDREEESFGFPEDPKSAVAIPLEPGSVVFFNGYLLHSSFPNRRASGFRRSLLFVYVSAETPMHWHPTDFHQASAVSDWRDIVLVAGKDPYAWKGVTDLGRAYVRKPGATQADRALADLTEQARA